MKTLRRLTRLTLVATLIALALCELGLRLAVSYVPAQAEPNGPFAHYTAAVFPYRYLNADMQWATHDLAVPNFTIRNNARVTSDQPSRYSRTVWLYGSSSVWGAFIDDGHTIASYLQREFNSRLLPWRVVNMGQPGIDISLELYWLHQSDVRPGDMVIFIDGGVDLKDAAKVAQSDWLAASLPCQASSRVPLLMLSLWCESVTSGTIPRQFVEQAESVEFPRYWNDIEQARQSAAKVGATFVHYMQPYPTAFPAGYDDYSLMYRADPRLFIDRADFVDDLHYTPHGHAAIADQIAAHLVTTF